MKIFIAGKGKSLNEMVDDRFARCGYFVTYDTEKKDIVSFEENPYKEGTGGVGVKVANYIINNGFEKITYFPIILSSMTVGMTIIRMSIGLK